MSLRRLHVLVQGLPDESATGRRVTHGWSIERELAAATVEQVAETNRLFVMANTDPKKRGQPPAPLRIPRPVDLMPAPAKTATRAEIAAFFTRRG